MRRWIFPLAGLKLVPVIPDPGKIICVGLNYHDHVVETGRTVTENPTLFARYPSSQVGYLQPLVSRPSATTSIMKANRLDRRGRPPSRPIARR
jgi:2-keto-4-pentenoate hydratase/2-oxohepta-3-ene-1,7-dioic acid hydratase in catechol pathway